MKKLVMTIAAVVACGSLFAEGNEVTWTGHGATAAWNDPDNWSAVPQEGDTAVFSEGTVTATTGDLETFGLFSGFRIETGATLFLDQFNGTLSQPLSGDGTFLATGAAGQAKSLTITADNRAFAGTFAFTNNYVKLNSPYGLGTTNHVHITVTTSNCHLEIMGGGPSVLSNSFHVASDSNRSAVFFNHYINSGVTLAGLVESIGGQCTFMSGGNTGWPITFSGGIAGKGQVLTSNSSGYAHTITGKPVDMTTSASVIENTTPLFANMTGIVRPFAGSFAISAKVLNAYLDADSSQFRFDAPNCSTENAHWGFGLSGNTPGSFDLNGYDQDCGNMAYIKQLPIETVSQVKILSEKKATLTMHGTMQHIYQSGSDPVDKRGRYPGLINGAVTFVLNSDLFATPGRIRFIGTGSTTSGGLVSSKGTIEVLSMASFPNLTLLSAENVGIMKIETAEIGTEGKGLTVKASDSAMMTINEGLVLQAKYAFLGGKWVEAGDYGGPDAGLDEKHTCANLAGAGIVRVAEYGGPKGLMLLVR